MLVLFRATCMHVKGCTVAHDSNARELCCVVQCSSRQEVLSIFCRRSLAACCAHADRCAKECKQHALMHALPASASCMQAGSVAATLQRARDDAQAAVAAAAQAAAAQAADEAAADARAAAAKKAAEARRRREPDAEAVAHVRRTLALARALDQARSIGAHALLIMQSIFCCKFAPGPAAGQCRPGIWQPTAANGLAPLTGCSALMSHCSAAGVHQRARRCAVWHILSYVCAEHWR